MGPFFDKVVDVKIVRASDENISQKPPASNPIEKSHSNLTQQYIAAIIGISAICLVNMRYLRI